MPVPSVITDLVPVAGDNSPAGTDTIGMNMDNYIRAHAAFISQLYTSQTSHASASASAHVSTAINFTNAGSGATVRTVESRLREFISVKDFGAVGDGVTDDTAAIVAADTAACAGTLGLDSATVIAEKAVYFPPGTYLHTSLTYRGAPWVGSGVNTTFLKRSGSSGPSIDCVGSLSARKLLSISDMTFDGSASTGTAYGLRLGHNYRSSGALRRVRITGFPGPGIYLKEDNWMLSFKDVYLSFNGADHLGTAIYVDSSATSLLSFDWFNLWIENNGYIGSGVAGLELPNSAILNWKFFGGVWEGNYGDAEARFTDCSGVYLYGTYLESDAGSVTNGLVFAGSTIGACNGLMNVAAVGKTGAAIVLNNTARVTLDQIRGSANWPKMLEVNNTATATLISDGYLFSPITVANGAQMHRQTAKRVQLTDAATIAIDASLGTSFYVTLTDNRTMGTPSNPSIGQQITFTIYQDGTGGRTLTWVGTYNAVWSDTGNTANKRSCVSFEYDGTYWNQISAQTPYI